MLYTCFQYAEVQLQPQQHPLALSNDEPVVYATIQSTQEPKTPLPQEKTDTNEPCEFYSMPNDLVWFRNESFYIILQLQKHMISCDLFICLDYI